MSGAALEARGLTKILAGEVPVTLVNGIDLTVSRAEFLSITGPSGSGKSSLLYLLGLLDRPTSGALLVNGESIADKDDDQIASMRLRNIGFIFQSHFLLPEFSALENVMLPMQRLGRLEPQAMHDRARTLLSELGLADHIHKIPRKLSGGQSQRVAIARALANQPTIILADEPTGNLDSASSAQVQAILRRLVREFATTVIVVTHDQDVAAAADRSIRIVDGKVA